jgi:hypothetical protein
MTDTGTVHTHYNIFATWLIKAIVGICAGVTVASEVVVIAASILSVLARVVSLHSG